MYGIRIGITKMYLFFLFYYQSMRLTAELIEKSASFINAVKDRELDLRCILLASGRVILDNFIRLR